MKNHKFYMLCIEGVDGTGKNTLSKAIVSRLREILGETAVKFISAPDYDGVYGKAIKALLTSEDYDAVNDPYSVQTISTIFSMDRISRIRPLVLDPGFLEQTTILVCDRWFYSNFMYQCSKLIDRSEIREWVKYNFRREFIDSSLCAVLSDIYTIVLEVDPEKNEKMISERNQMDRYEKNSNYRQKCIDFIKNFDRTILDDESCPEVIRKFYYDNVKILPIEPVEKDENFDVGIRANAEYVIRNVPFLKAIIDPPTNKHDEIDPVENPRTQFFKFTYSLEKLYEIGGISAVEMFNDCFIDERLNKFIDRRMMVEYNRYHSIRWTSKNTPKFEFVLFCVFDPLNRSASKTLRQEMYASAIALEDAMKIYWALVRRRVRLIDDNSTVTRFDQLSPRYFTFDNTIIFRVPKLKSHTSQFEEFLDGLFNTCGANCTSAMIPIEHSYVENGERKPILYYTLSVDPKHRTVPVEMIAKIFDDYFKQS